MDGLRVVGEVVGIVDGRRLEGMRVGPIVGLPEGENVDVKEYEYDGNVVGSVDGNFVGRIDGVTDGGSEGYSDGTVEGRKEGKIEDGTLEGI